MTALVSQQYVQQTLNKKAKSVNLSSDVEKTGIQNKLRIIENLQFGEYGQKSKSIKNVFHKWL